MTTKTIDQRITRAHNILTTRAEQIRLNLLAVAGGHPYIEARLARLPYESDVSWAGEDTLTNSTIGTGRKDRAFLINYAGRITRKINQFVFSNEVKRLNADPVFLADTTRTGTPINAFMARVSEIVTAARWCWISVDRDSLSRDTRGQPVQRSVADKEASGDRVFWSVWEPDEVIDWNFDRSGKLRWVITEQEVYDNSDITQPAQTRVVRTIWTQGGGTRLWLDSDDKEKITLEEPFVTSLDDVGFIPVGQPSADAWWFDDVEMIVAAMLNLESSNIENLYHANFPQLVIPEGMVNNIMDTARVSNDRAVKLIRGLGYPMIESQESSGLTRYLMPNSSDMKTTPDQIQRLSEELMKIVGLALQNQDSRQVSSAEAKAWDHLDPEAVLKERAQILEEAETKAVILSKRLDNTFKEYLPIYGKSFNLTDVKDDISSLLEIKSLGLPPAMNNEFLRAGLEYLDRLIGIPEQKKQEYISAINKL